MCDIANPDYLGFSLTNLLDLLELWWECVEFPEDSEKLCKKMAGFCQNTSRFTEYPNFSESSTGCNVVPVKFM